MDELKEETNSSQNVMSAIGNVIDCTEEELLDFLKDKNLGYVHGLTVVMESVWVTLVSMYQDYNKLCDTHENSEKYDKAMADIFTELTKIELRQAFLIEYENKLLNQ